MDEITSVILDFFLSCKFASSTLTTTLSLPFSNFHIDLILGIALQTLVQLIDDRVAGKWVRNIVL